METIKSKAEMMREFHAIMGVTCANCNHALSTQNPNFISCDGIWKGKSWYCQEWEEKGAEDESNL